MRDGRAEGMRLKISESEGSKCTSYRVGTSFSNKW